MLNFNMGVEENFCMFKDEKKVVVVESHDNKVFDISKGSSVDDLKYLTSIYADNDNELNKQLRKLFPNKTK